MRVNEDACVRTRGMCRTPWRYVAPPDQSLNSPARRCPCPPSMYCVCHRTTTAKRWSVRGWILSKRDSQITYFIFVQDRFTLSDSPGFMRPHAHTQGTWKRTKGRAGAALQHQMQQAHRARNTHAPTLQAHCAANTSPRADGVVSRSPAGRVPRPSQGPST